VRGAAGQIDVNASWVDLSGTTVTTGRQNTSITTATTTTIVPAPASSTTRNLKAMRVSNNHASISQAVTVRVTDGTTTVPLESVTLAPGEAIAYHESTGMRVLAANGVERASSGATLTTGFSSLNVTANAADTYVGGFQGAARIQAGSTVTWRIVVSKTGAGVAAPIFTFRTGTGTTGAVGDTSRVALTSPFAQTGVADTGVIIAFATLRSHGSGTGGVLVAGYQLGHALAATGLAVQPAYGQSGVSAGFDTTSASLIVGLSINPGTAGVWTCDVSGVATNLIG
jgi:hypothetical protein